MRPQILEHVVEDMGYLMSQLLGQGFEFTEIGGDHVIGRGTSIVSGRGQEHVSNPLCGNREFGVRFYFLFSHCIISDI